MSTSQMARRKRDKSSHQTRFQRLWAEAEMLAQENTEFEQQLEALVGRVDREVLTVEREMGVVIRQFVYRQLGFAHRKSLLKWQREVLNEWIDENLSHLMAMGLLDEPLQNEIASLRAFEMGIALDVESDLSPAEQLDQILNADEDDDDGTPVHDDGRHRHFTGDQFDDADIDDVDVDDQLEELLRKLHGESAQSQAETRRPPSDNPGRTDKGGADKGGVFKRLFRQTAAALHPDRESDESRRQEKHALMSQLLQARKEHDLVTILALHQQHVDTESELSGDDQLELESVLVDYLNQQQARQEEIIWQSPMHRMAFQQFYDRTPATVTRRIRKHVETIEDQRQALLAFMQEVKTLKSFKDVLAARYDSRMMSDTWS